MRNIYLVIIVLLLAENSICFSQDTDTEEQSGDAVNRHKKLHAGLFIGSYFANKYTADLYDGYGLNFEGKKNTFENSNMYHKIIEQYGGGYGGEDYIATALGIGHDDWSFTESDMPVNMRYKPSFAIGLNCKYSTDNRNAILFNLDLIKLTITGNFTIYTRPSSGATQINNSIKTFAIKGIEQRMLLQMGYQRILGKSDNFNFFVEGGLHVTFAKLSKNLIQINNLQIDLIDYPNIAGYPVNYPDNYKTGTGFGVFAGMGVNITSSSKWTLQLLYSPTLENVNIGINPRLKLQNDIGLRAYYML